MLFTHNRSFRRLPAFFRYVMYRFKANGCLQIAANLTFTTLLSLVPILTIILALSAAFPAFSGIIQALKNFVFSNFMPDTSAATMIYHYFDQFSANAGKMTLLGVMVLCITAFFLMNTIEQTFNHIWRVYESRTLLQRLVLYWAILSLGPLLLGSSLSLTNWLLNLPYLRTSLFNEFVLSILPLLITISGLTLLYATVASRRVPPQQALIGGAVAGLLFEIMKFGFGFYLHSFSTYQTIYGTFAVVPIFLIWIDLSWIVILWGAVLTASLKEFHHYERSHPRKTGWQIFTTLLVLSALQDSKKPLSSQDLLDKIYIEPKPLEDLLQTLTSHHYIHQHDNCWILSHSLPGRSFSELAKLFMLGDLKHPPVNGEKASKLTEVIPELYSTILKNTDLPIQDILNKINTERII